MKKYSINGLSTSGTGPQTAFTLVTAGAATARPLLSECVFGVRTNPNTTDQQVRFAVGTFTTLGTNTAATPKPLDAQDPVTAITIAGVLNTAEPTTFTAFWIDSDINQRGLYRWVAEIGFELGAVPSATAGIAGKMILVTAALQMSQNVSFKE